MSRKPAHVDLFQKRRSGVLLHPSSFPGADTDGALGEEAYRFVRFLVDAGISVWQMLPVNSTGKYESPYQGTSIHAGNVHLISISKLLESDWLSDEVIEKIKNSDMDLHGIIRLARTSFDENATDGEKEQYHQFKQQEWLEDYALFCLIKSVHKQAPWWEWPEPLRNREETKLRSYTKKYASQLDDLVFEQFIFYEQWHALKHYANENGVLLFGDLPILIAHDSAGVWIKKDYFQLDASGQPTAVAGVPPDYFSKTGQRWGNPLYNWEKLAEDGYQWWINRLRTQLELFDLVRLDHFRGFVSLWEIPAQCETAIDGHWQPVPGREVFNTLEKEFGPLPIVAEDLGTIDQDVLDLRDDFGLPGMKVLMFAFDSEADNPYLPHQHNLKSVIYTGTHDNDTTLGWFNALTEQQQKRIIDYLGQPTDPMPWPLIHAALMSVCPMAVIPLQDLLGLDGEHRMNTPGTVEGNWLWQFQWDWLPDDLASRLRHLNTIYGRI